MQVHARRPALHRETRSPGPGRDHIAHSTRRGQLREAGDGRAVSRWWAQIRLAIFGASPTLRLRSKARMFRPCAEGRPPPPITGGAPATPATCSTSPLAYPPQLRRRPQTAEHRVHNDTTGPTQVQAGITRNRDQANHAQNSCARTPPAPVTQSNCNPAPPAPRPIRGRRPTPRRLRRRHPRRVVRSYTNPRPTGRRCTLRADIRLRTVDQVLDLRQKGRSLRSQPFNGSPPQSRSAKYRCTSSGRTRHWPPSTRSGQATPPKFQ